MLKKTTLLFSLIALPLTANAEWLAGGGVNSITNNEDSIDKLTLGSVYASIGYKYQKDNQNLAFLPELRIGTGIKDDEVYGVDVEVSRFLALSVRGQYHFENNIYAYAMPSYANLKLKASGYGTSASDDDWEFGLGLGLGYQVNEKANIEASYEDYDGTDIYSVSIKYSF